MPNEDTKTIGMSSELVLPLHDGNSRSETVQKMRATQTSRRVKCERDHKIWLLAIGDE